MPRKRARSAAADQEDVTTDQKQEANGAKKRSRKPPRPSVVAMEFEGEPAVMTVEDSRGEVTVRPTRKAAQDWAEKKGAIMRDRAYMDCLLRQDIRAALASARVTLAGKGFYGKFDHDPGLRWKLKVLEEIGQIKLPPRLQLKQKPFRFLDMPEDIRIQVYKCVALSNLASNLFIYPANSTGQEQPDLAMTCCQVRNEVLPIFYRHNVFAMKLETRGLPIVTKWLQVMQDAGWLSYVRRFAFVYQPSDRTAPNLFVSFKPKEDRPARKCVYISVHNNVQCLLDCSASCHALTTSWELSPDVSNDLNPPSGDLGGVREVVGLFNALAANDSWARNTGCSRPAGVRSKPATESSTA